MLAEDKQENGAELGRLYRAELEVEKVETESALPLVQDGGAEELFQAMELEMEARAPSNAAFLSPPPGRLAAFGTWVLSFVIPGLGMFTEAYFVFSVRALVHCLSQCFGFRTLDGPWGTVMQHR